MNCSFCQKPLSAQHHLLKRTDNDEVYHVHISCHRRIKEAVDLAVLNDQLPADVSAWLARNRIPYQSRSFFGSAVDP